VSTNYLQNGSWKKFLMMHWDTLFGRRLYLLLIIQLKSRKIVSWNLTENPSREFVKQRIQLFSEDFPEKKTLIYTMLLNSHPLIIAGMMLMELTHHFRNYRILQHAKNASRNQQDS